MIVFVFLFRNKQIVSIMSIKNIADKNFPFSKELLKLN